MNSIIDSLTQRHGWELTRFGHIVERRKDVGSADLEPLSVFLDGVYRRADRLDANHNRLGDDLGRYLKVRRGDLVFNKLRTWQGGFGHSPHDGIVSPAYFVCRPNTAEPRYLDYLLHSAPYLQELTRLSKWMPPSQFDIGWNELKQIPVLSPSKADQRRIADYLDAETARIDALIGAKHYMIDRARERTSAVLDEVFGCRKPLTRWDGVPVAVDKNWPMVRLAQVATVQSGLTLDAGREHSGATSEVPYMRVANVQDGSVDLTEVKSVNVDEQAVRRHSLRRGDVLMTEGGDPDKLGRGAVWQAWIDPCLHQNHVFAVRPDPGRLEPAFLSLLTRTTYARAYFEMTATKTTGIASTSATKIGSFRVPVPPLVEQRALVADVATDERTVTDLAATLARQIELLRERRQALITSAVTGEMEVP